LGDATIVPRCAYLGIVHCRDQRQYVELKARALRELSPVVYDGACSAAGKQHLTTVCRTRASRALRVVRSRFYDGRKKRVPRDLRVTPRIAAIWFMDDGYTRVRSSQNVLSEIAAHSFSADERRFLIERLQADLGVTAYERESSPGRLHFGTVATKRLAEVIAPFVPSTMRYKLHPVVEQRIPFDPSLFEPGPAETLFDRVCIEPVEFAGHDRSFFCIDVEDTNNFVTSGGVVHNCRPPNNRVPMPDEVATCTPYLERQLEIIRPKVIVTLGLPSLKYMMNDPKLTMGRSRGHWREWRGIKLMPTFHPAYVLRQYTDETRAAVWSDLKQVLVELGLPIPKRGGSGGAEKSS
jgi:uracil-DNA glycosylase family 4